MTLQTIKPLEDYLKEQKNRRNNLLTNVPQRELVKWSAKLYTVMNLAWGYVLSVCDICAQMKLGETKELSRKVRKLKREYDDFRGKSIHDNEYREETTRGESFEDNFSTDFDKLFYGLENEVSKIEGDKSRRTLLVAVHQAMALVNTSILYAQWVDVQIRRYGVWAENCSIMQVEFLRMSRLVPMFGMGKYDKDSPTRKSTERILFNRMQEIAVIIEGKIFQ